MRVAIIGGGYIGQSLRILLEGKGVEHVMIRRDEIDYASSERIHDIRNMFRGCNAVVNCSGYTGRPNVDAAETDRINCQLMNVAVPLSIRSVAENLNVPYYHISSGCIYNGYDKLWTEEDMPNFGVNCSTASWYSKTKHMAEIELASWPCYVIRPRMPFGTLDMRSTTDRDFIGKLRNYDILVNTLNSKTYIPDLCKFIYDLIMNTRNVIPDKIDIYNYTQIEPLDTRTIMKMMTACGKGNDNWNVVDWENLSIVANRSNCILSMNKVMQQGYKVRREIECLEEHL